MSKQMMDNAETVTDQFIGPQLEIGKAVIEGMIRIYHKDGVVKNTLISATFNDKEFIIEVRLKNE